MRTFAKITSAFAICLLTMNCMCEDPMAEMRRRGAMTNPEPVPTACDPAQPCTGEFVRISVTMKTNAPLDEVYTIRERTGSQIRPEQPNAPASFVVLDDSFLSRMANRTETFRLVGIRNGRKVVNEPFTISADCCHIQKIKGNDHIVVDRTPTH